MKGNSTSRNSPSCFNQPHWMVIQRIQWLWMVVTASQVHLTERFKNNLTWHHVFISNHHWIYYTNGFVKKNVVCGLNESRVAGFNFLYMFSCSHTFSDCSATLRLTHDLKAKLTFFIFARHLPRGTQRVSKSADPVSAPATLLVHSRRASTWMWHECKQRNLFELKLRKKHAETSRSWQSLKGLSQCDLPCIMSEWRLACANSTIKAASPFETSSHAVRIVSTLPGKSVSHRCISVGCGFGRYVLI